MASINAYTKVAKELYNRLTTAAQAGNKLSDVVRVYMGQRKYTFQGKDLPAIVVPFEDFSETFELGHCRNHKGAFLSFSIDIIYQVKDDREENLLFVDGDPDSGFIPLIERVLDVLSETTALKIQPRISDDSEKSFDLTGEITRQEDMLICSITLVASTEKFLINGRYTTS